MSCSWRDHIDSLSAVTLSSSTSVMRILVEMASGGLLESFIFGDTINMRRQ